MSHNEIDYGYGRDLWFRGKSIRDGKWIRGDLNDNGNQCFIIPFNSMREHNGNFGLRYLRANDYEEIDPKTIGQYTGMKDVNETEIFGGDIVENDNGEVFIVEYWTGQVIVGWYLRSARTDDTQEMYCFGDSLRKIGNIFDNPELLEVDQ